MKPGAIHLHEAFMKHALKNQPVLVTGSTGYVGGRLVPLLLDSGYRVRVTGRSLKKIQARPWSKHPALETVQADVLDKDSLLRAVDGCWAAFYLVHSMNPSQKDFSRADRKAAENMVAAAEQAGLEKIIYLGGLGREEAVLSKHLRSRMEVGRTLQSGNVPTTFLRAAMILGSGNASFEILRYLVEHLPVMITPRWVRNPVQPIAVSNVLNYLKGCLEHDETTGQTFDIGGPDILTYEQLMQIYAQEAGLKKRLIIPVPVLTPRLSSLWIHLVTPVPAYIARPLAEGLRNPVICLENRIRSIVNQELLPCRETIQRALGRIKQGCLETCWIDSGNIAVPEWRHNGDTPYAGGKVMESGHRLVLAASDRELWKIISSIGGNRAWYSSKFLWSVRGLMDRLAGGIGLRLGRRNPLELHPGDSVDFFRVLDVQENHRLYLLAEMKIPGEATLEFRIRSLEDGNTELQQISRFLPHGLTGLIYWYMFHPFHQRIFKSMMKGIARIVRKPMIKGPERFRPTR